MAGAASAGSAVKTNLGVVPPKVQCGDHSNCSSLYIAALSEETCQTKLIWPPLHKLPSVLFTFRKSDATTLTQRLPRTQLQHTKPGS